MLNIEHLTKTYGGKAAVQDLSLHIRPGEICAFIGHNGAGKTTTLKCCCGIQQFDSGRITVDGISVQDDPLECKRRLAYLPDNPDLYEYMTGIQYLNFIADIFAVGARERAERIRSYGDQFDLTQDLAQPISAYSHGRCPGPRFAGLAAAEKGRAQLPQLLAEQCTDHHACASVPSSSRKTSSRLSSPRTSSMEPARTSRPARMMATRSQSFSATSST